MKKLYVLLITLFFVGNIFSQTTYTTLDTDGTDYLWSTSTNWDANGVPPATINANDIVNVNYSIMCDVATTNNGTINVASGVILYPYTVTLTIAAGVLDVIGQIDPDYGTLIITSNGTLKAHSNTICAGTDADITINGTYDYAVNGGNLEAFTLVSTSTTLKLSGMTNTYPAALTNCKAIEFASSGLTVDLSPTAIFLSNFEDIIITETNGKSIKFPEGSTHTITGDLTIGANTKAILQASTRLTVSGTLTNNAGAGGLVIESNATRTGSLITTSTGVVGTFKQLLVGNRWYLITPPFDGVTVDDFHQAGGGDDTYMRPYISPGGGWGDYFVSLDQALNVGKGYEYWEDDDNGDNWTFNKSGTFITGDQTLSVTSGGTVNANWNLVGNPYPCGLNWASVADKTNCEGSSFYVYNGAKYLAHNGTSGTGLGDVGDATNGIIPPFQGFFVERLASGGSNNVAIANADKAHAGIKLYKSAKSDYFNHFKVKATALEQASVCVIYQQEDATNGDDKIYDASLLFSDDANLMEVYSLAGEKQAAINIYGEYPYSVNLGFKVPVGGGEFTIEPFDFRNMDNSFEIILEDLRNGHTQSFVDGDSYTFTLTESGITEDRIVLHLNSTVGIEAIKDVNTTIYASRNTVYINSDKAQSYDIQIINMMGQEVYTGRSNAQGLYSISLNEPTAYYVVRVISANVTVTQKIFIEN